MPLSSFLCLLLLAGGWVGAEIGNTIERFDPEENSWDVVGSMAVPRYCFGCCEMQGESIFKFVSIDSSKSHWTLKLYVSVVNFFLVLSCAAICTRLCLTYLLF